jgi:hypothetical protein
MGRVVWELSSVHAWGILTSHKCSGASFMSLLSYFYQPASPAPVLPFARPRAAAPSNGSGLLLEGRCTEL